MLIVVVVCMVMDWMLSKQLTNYLETEALLNHLSLRTVHQIQYNHWVHQFYGAILTALVACLVFLRSLGIDFFHEYEVVVETELVEAPPEPQPPVSEVPLEEEIAPPELLLANQGFHGHGSGSHRRGNLQTPGNNTIACQERPVGVWIAVPQGVRYQD